MLQPSPPAARPGATARSTSGAPAPAGAPNRRDLLALGAGLAAGSSLVGCRTQAAGEVPPSSPEREAELDELFADLADRSGDVEPIAPAEHAARRARLAARLEEHGAQAFLCEGGATMSYLSGVRWGLSERLFALVVVADGSHFFACPAFEVDRARLALEAAGAEGDVVPWDEHEYAWRPLAAELGRRRARRVLLDSRARLFVAERLEAELGEGSVGSGSALVRALRGRKDEHELRLLRRANELTQEAILAASHHLRPGMRSPEVAELMAHAQRRLGLERVWVLALLGPDAALPHGGENATVLAPGEVVLVDTGGSLHGYQSDNTRSWVFEAAPTEHQARVWTAVRDAQRRAFEAIAPGVRCGDVDAVARGSLDADGFGPGYTHLTHRLGHGIGMEGHEWPYFDGGSDVALEPGMTLSDEPGVYLRDVFGIRLEDIVVATPQGADHFGTWQRGPRSPA